MINNTAADVKKNIVDKHADVLSNLKSLYIFGASRLGRKCKDSCIDKGIKVEGFIDNNLAQTGFLDGIPVVSFEEFKSKYAEKIVVIASLNYWNEIEAELLSTSIKYLHYSILSLWDPEHFPPAELCFDGIIEDVVNNHNRYQQLQSVMSDCISMDILDLMIKFRLTLDSRYTREAYNISAQEGNQYFEHGLINLHGNEHLVDGGGYLGETSLQFINRLITRGLNYNKISFVEPDHALMKQAKINLAHCHDINFYEIGLSDKRETLLFNNTGDMGGTFSSEGSSQCFLDTIDHITNEEATFIKLDIEGFEKQALLGAKETILKQKPKIAISAYHRAGDIWRLYETVANIRNDYKVFLRHYTPNIFDTVLYFV